MKQLATEVMALQHEIEVHERQNSRNTYNHAIIKEIDPAMLREQIQAIYVEAPDKSNGKRKQHIHIKYDGIGFLPLDELIKYK